MFYDNYNLEGYIYISSTKKNLSGISESSWFQPLFQFKFNSYIIQNRGIRKLKCLPKSNWILIVEIMKFVTIFHENLSYIWRITKIVKDIKLFHHVLLNYCFLDLFLLSRSCGLYSLRSTQIWWTGRIR